MKNCKTFYETQTTSFLKEIIQPPPRRQPDKILLRLRNKHFLTEIYRNIQTFTFKELQECISWVSKNGLVQMFFLTPNKKYLLENLQSEKGFWLCSGSILFSIPSELRLVKSVRFFKRNCIF